MSESLSPKALAELNYLEDLKKARAALQLRRRLWQLEFILWGGLSLLFLMFLGPALVSARSWVAAGGAILCFVVLFLWLRSLFGREPCVCLL